MGFPGGSEGKASACNAGNPGSVPGSGRSPGEGNSNPLQWVWKRVTLAWKIPWTKKPGYNSWGHKESDTTERLHFLFFHFLYLTYMQSTSYKMLGWIKHKLESRLLGEISITSDTQITSPLWQKVKKN